jgi:hypothetical protein
MMSDSAGQAADRRPKDRPWMMRTYAGHSSAVESNKLYRRNLAKGQTGLSVAFDLPTQTGYDPDSVLARGEVGKVGVPVSHIGDMRALFTDIPLGEMNTSMTINATAMWLLALYQSVAEEQGASPEQLQGTTQNDIIKEYLSRGTYVFPPGPSLRLITDMISYTVNNIPKWNPINICSYHLQEAGATPVQEIAYSMSTAMAVLDSVRDSGQVPEEEFGKVVARISFFVNAGRLHGSYVGQSEKQLREALLAAEAMSPVVLWIDEIEKAFAGAGDNDSGASRRVLGVLLRWLQERPDGIFVVATSNDVTSLPPELARRGRFDELFFVDLPDPLERSAILTYHLQQRDRDPRQFDLNALATATDGFSGAEIESMIVASLYTAFAASSPLTTEHLLAEASSTIPLSVTRSEDIAALRNWSVGRARPAGGHPPPTPAR